MATSGDYTYDVFLSYSRHGEWPFWVKRWFVPLFSHWLGEEVPNARIFVDYDMPEGCSWPLYLAQALSLSKVMVALWSPRYFESDWCLAELSHMAAREVNCGFRTPQCPQGLIFPASLHDGDRFPSRAREIQYLNLQSCSSVRIAHGSRTAEELDAKIRKWVPTIAAAIMSPPELDPAWNSLVCESFLAAYKQASPRTIQLPRFD